MPKKNGGRPKKMETTKLRHKVAIRFDDEIMDWLNLESLRRKVSASVVIRDAIIARMENSSLSGRVAQ